MATHSPPSPPPAPLPPEKHWIARTAGEFFALRGDLPLWKAAFYGLLCVALVFGLWWYVTYPWPVDEQSLPEAPGPEEEIVERKPVTRRIIPYQTLPSPAETFGEFRSLWEERFLTLNTLVSLRRVVLGFALASLVGIPLGVLAGCFPRVNAFLTPLTIFGRNIPIAALVPLTFLFFDIGETQKVMFIFIAAVAFIVSDTARAIMDVGTPYIDTAYTLGASRWQVILKVLVPLAMPSVFNSLRLLFGLAFGYIMLAELVKSGGELGGLGHIIETSQRIGPREHIYLVLLIIPVVALVIDRILYWIQRELFPYRYGGAGVLNQVVRGIMHLWDDGKSMFWKPTPAVQAILSQAREPERARS